MKRTNIFRRDFLRKTIAAAFAFIIVSMYFSGARDYITTSDQTEENKEEEAQGSEISIILNKTLVAWVYLANTTQRGGSALTLIDPVERIDPTRFIGEGGSRLKSVDSDVQFDAIVFAELTQGKWMAGSNVFQPTQLDQETLPEETADARTLVKMAIVYKDDKVCVYRDGRLYSDHTIGKQLTFDQNAKVLIGLRYRGKYSKQGFLAGKIEEARIYNVALDKAVIDALEAGKPSEPEPIALWTFENGTTADSMGRFPPGKLCGNARITDGKLYLDGKTSYMITPPPEETPMGPKVQTMFYKPTLPETGSMWDSWVLFHEERYYLYTTCNAGGNLLDNVSMASSSDGVHWMEIGRVLSRHTDSDWMGTGSTWKSCNFENDGKFFMDFCERREGGRRVQEIYFAESTDLVHWKRLDGKHVFKTDQRWYTPGCWTTIWTIPRPDGGLYGYWTCVPKPDTGGSFGFGETLDGLTWRALQPPKVHGVGYCELGAIEKIGPKYYSMVGIEGVMHTLVADRPSGPFYLSKKNARLLGGKKSKTHRGEFFAYFTRFCRAPDGLLVSHHTIARDGQVYFGLLKSAVVDEQGTLRLGWWKGNEKLKSGVTPLTVSMPIVEAGSSISMLSETFNVGTGMIIEGKLTLPVSKDSSPVGLYVSCGEDYGSAILFHVNARCELGEIKADGSEWNVENLVDREMNFGSTPMFRLLLRHSVLEFYLNDILIECYSLPASATGQIGLVGNVLDVKVWD